MKPVLVTGGAKRLGAAIAREIAGAGWTPVIHYSSSKDEAEALAGQLGGAAIGTDLSDTGNVADLVPKAAQAVGAPLVGLINNASIFVQDRPESVSADSLDQHLRVNLISPLLLGRAFAEQLPEDIGGIIVNLIDQKLWNPHPDFFSYTLSKAGLKTATDLMAQAFAPKVRVMGVAPGYCLPAPGQAEADFLKKAASVNALHQRLAPQQIAQTVRFCLENNALTGQTIITANGEHLVPTDGDISLQ